MSTTLFRDIGPYKIEREIGRGGMAQVFLATDTRSGRAVALKVVPDGDDPDAREILAAEQRGAELQQEFSRSSQHVPHVYDVGFATGYFYIAMEYIDGEDLSSIIRRGPVSPGRAVEIAIQLCRFLEEVDRATTGEDELARLTLLHNDLKPTNVRLIANDRVKVLDFGAAKALSLSRKVTRNDFGSIAYLSPECLDSGERDRQTDAWALGVLLYEMVAGHAPFRADDTRRLENRIRSRKPPEPLVTAPEPLRAVIAKLLAPQPDDRYAHAAAIRADLERLRLGVATFAEGEGWPDRVVDEAPTRRTQTQPAGAPAPADAAATRRTQPQTAAEVEPATRRTIQRPPVSAVGGPAPAEIAAAPTPPIPSALAEKPPRRFRRLRTVLLVGGLLIVVNEGCVAMRANRLSPSVAAAQKFEELPEMWARHDSLAGWSFLGGFGVSDLRQALTKQTLILAEQVIGNYRTPAPSVREAQWQAAADALRRAVASAPDNREIRGAMRYAEGHLHRIDGEANKTRKGGAELMKRSAENARRDFAEAITAFRDAAELRPNWADPFLGLARTFIYGMEDMDLGADAMARAQKLGYTLGTRETTQLAEGYRARGEALQASAGKLAGMPQERDVLTRALEAYRKALDEYSKIAGSADVPTKMKVLQIRVDAIQRQLEGGGTLADILRRLPWA